MEETNRESGRDKFTKNKKKILFLVKIIKILPEKKLEFLLNLISSSRLKICILFRYIILKAINYELGDNVYIASNVVLKNISKLKIGNNVSIHEFSYIDAYGGIEIGNDVSIAHSTSIISFEHAYNKLDISIKYQGLIKKKIIIQDNVWIGCGSRILGGSILKSGVVIGANSIIKNELEENSVYCCPKAIFIKRRI